MAAERKLKAEIDKTLKKVAEGQELFEDLWTQVHDCENNNQREKLEGELKKEIKKLQRLREQIKAWITSADIKDKQPLMDVRKSIERDMERFKACEKESKIKGINRVYNDPKEKAKDEAREWINTTVDAITSKMESFDYEMEELSGNMKKKQKPPPRLAELEDLLSQFREHVDNLEKVLRCIDNETIQPDELEDLKNDLELFISPDDDSYGDMASVEDMYAALQDRMDAVDNAAPPTAVVKPVNKGKEKEDADREREREKDRERERAVAAAAKAQLVAQGNTAIKIEEEEMSKKAPALGIPVPPPKPPLPPAAAVALLPVPPPPAARAPANAATLNGSRDASLDGAASILSAAPVTPRAAATTASSAATNATPPGMPGFQAAAPPVAPAPVRPPATAAAPSSNWLSATTGGVAAVDVAAGAATPAPPPAPPGRAEARKGAKAAGTNTLVVPPASPPPPAPPTRTAVGPPGVLLAGDAQSEVSNRSTEAGSTVDQLAGATKGLSLSDSRGSGVGPAPSPEVLNLTSMPAPFTLQAARQILDATHQRALPQQSDTDWRKHKPRHPAAVPSSFPRSQHEVVESAQLFKRLDPECLFFAFYFQPDTYQQFLAAHELKRQSWRFHKHHNAWFQRFTEPTITSDEYEQGAYVYFDYNIVHDDLLTGWCYRRKENFTFRYDALEDELRPQPPALPANTVASNAAPTTAQA